MIVGTLGKALGGYGAFAACDRTMARYLVNAARTFIFSTALPPPAVAGALAALELLEERPRRVQKLAANAAALREGLQDEGFDVGGSRTQILPLVFGDAELAMRICEGALLHGVFAQAIRPPTVPAMTSRLRLAVMATHHADELRQAARTLGSVARALGHDPRRVMPVGARRVGAGAPVPTGIPPPPRPMIARRHLLPGPDLDRRPLPAAPRRCSTSRRPSPSAAPRSSHGS